MEFFHKKTNFRFMATRKVWYTISAVLMVASFASFLRGLNFAIDFRVASRSRRRSRRTSKSAGAPRGHSRRVSRAAGELSRQLAQCRDRPAIDRADGRPVRPLFRMRCARSVRVRRLRTSNRGATGRRRAAQFRHLSLTFTLALIWATSSCDSTPGDCRSAPFSR